MCFLFLLNSKIKYTSQKTKINHILYKTHKSTTFDLNIKIVIVAVVTQYKMQTPFLGCSQLVWVRIRWDNDVRARCRQKIEDK